jgi:hypothetical protein
MNWLWAYFRRKTMEAILAGANDAISDGGSRLSDEEAVRALRAMLGGAAQGGDTTALPPPPPPPALQETRRGPGRPRKFQEPPTP